MQFLTSLFGGAENSIITAIIALGIVLVLIVLGLWALKLLFRASNDIGRGRVRRLSIVDAVTLDARRQLLIVRRDNVEHVILTGGPQDVVVESGIPVERPAPPARRPQSPAPVATAATPSPLPQADAPVARPAVKAAQDAVQNLVPLSAARASAPMERLRDLGRPVGQRKSTSLRHTGLMRPVSRMEAAVFPIISDKAGRPELDSGTSGPVADGQARLGARHFGDGYKAEGN